MLTVSMDCFMVVNLLLVGAILSGTVVEGWSEAHATYYGGNDASGTNDGACGYANVFSLGYGTMTTALSAPLFQDGHTCGGCFEIKCNGDQYCLNGSPSIIVTATNLCPQGSNGGWCDYPKSHFDLSEPAFSLISQVIAGHVPVLYQRTACTRSGGIHFQIVGHTYYMQVLITNVGGAGDVQAVSVLGAKSGKWIALDRTWGQNWCTGQVLDGQALSFQVTTSDGKTITSTNVASSSWQYGQTFSGGQF